MKNPNQKKKMTNLKMGVLSAAVVCGLFSTSMAYANDPYASPRLRNAIGYEFNGGIVPEPATDIVTYPILDMQVKWDILGACGEFDPDISIQGVFNGITEGFRDYMDGLIGAATSAVAGLPGLILKRVDPGLYDIIEEGMLQADLDFSAAKASCENIQNWMLGEGESPFKDFAIEAKVGEWTKKIGMDNYGGPPGGGGASTPPPAEAAGNGILAAQQIEDEYELDDGIAWVCNEIKGGQGQELIEVIEDVVIAGYNSLIDRDPCDETAVPALIGDDDPMYTYWPEPADAVEFITLAVGDIEVATCNNCRKETPLVGKGLLPLHFAMADQLRTDIFALVNGTTAMTRDNLDAVSARPSAVVDDQLIFTLRGYAPASQNTLITHMANEIAYGRLFEQARLAVMIFRSGLMEPNVASAGNGILSDVHDAIDKILEEQNLVRLELEEKKRVSSYTIDKVMFNAERRIQSATETPRNTHLPFNSLGTKEN